MTKDLRDLIREAKACQWERSKGPKRPDTDSESGKPVGAPPSDPTADAALDPLRLDLRAAIRRAELAQQYGGDTDRAFADLATALDRWAGHI